MPIYGVANNRRQQNRINARRKRDKAVKQFKEDHGVDQREVDAWACRIYFFFGCIPCLILNFLGTVFWEKLLRRSCDADCPTVHEWCGCPQSVVFGDATTKKDYSGMPHCEPSHGGSPGHYWADEAYQLPERPGRSSQDAFELVMAAPESEREAVYRRLAAPAEEADETRAEEADEKRGYAGKKWPTPGAAAPPPPADEEAPPRDEESPPDVAEFRRLLDVMPEGAVRQRMVLAGLDPNLLDAPDEAPPAVVMVRPEHVTVEASPVAEPALPAMIAALRRQLPGLPPDGTTKEVVDAACADLGVDAPDASLLERARLCYAEVT